MKKFLSVFLTVIMIIGSLSAVTFAMEDYPVKRKDFRIRDPYILVHEGKYYMYGTCLSNGAGYGCCVSENLEDWSKPVQIYSPANGSDEIDDFWAPECHYYEGSFYLFATYRSASSGKRGTAIFKASSPLGPFENITNGHITPKERDCIDGTLYIDKNGQPWIVYVNEWTSNDDEIGEMAAAKLSDDLTELVSEPIVLFKANKHIWTGTNNFITDGPCLYRTSNNRLIMLWSNTAISGGYAVGMAVSDNGEIDGNWIHYPNAFYKNGLRYEFDGGHPMLFETLEGQLMMSIHSPNSRGDGIHETATFYPIEDRGDTIAIESGESVLSDAADFFTDLLNEIYYRIVILFVK